MKNTLLIFALLILIAPACKKKDEPKFVDQASDELVKYVINLSGLKITEYSKYINDEFVEITIFYDYDSVIERIRKNADDKVILKSVYRLDWFNLPLSSVDSSFGEQDIDVYQSNYLYVDGFWVEKKMLMKNGETTTDFYFTRLIENENVIQFNIVEPPGCSYKYSFNNQINKLDLNFSNGITGNWNKNLVEHASWNEGCPCGPSSSIATSDYKYELNSEGFVTKRIETYTPCYHLTDPGTVTRTIYTTVYEYHLN
jgi:hypothetical protein